MPPPRKKRVQKPIALSPPKVFLVHGHDEGKREMVARFLEKIGCKPIILHEQASRGTTLFQKFTTHAGVEFAVILLTGDDQGGDITIHIKQQRKRARQNVILELGFFLGALGPAKVCSLYEAGVELPSDYSGMVYIPLNKDEKWKTLLARELASAGLSIDPKLLLTI
jgi:predicted nucleotide-binding protein